MGTIMNKKIITLVLIIIVIAIIGIYLALTFYGGTKTKLVVITRLSPEESEALRKAFLTSDIAKKYNIVDVEFRKLDYALWRDLAISGDVDLFLIGEVPIYSSMCEEGLFRAIDMKDIIDITSKLDPSLIGKDKNENICWLAIGRAVYGYILNKDFIKQYKLSEPKKWADISNPKFAMSILKDALPISFPLPSKSGTAKTIVHAILQKYGWEYGWEILTSIGALSRIVDSSEKARDEAAEGIVALAPAYIGYGILAENVSKGKAIFVVPEGEGVMYISPVAIAKNSKHPQEAQAFILWLLSDEGQRTIARLFYYIPVRPIENIEWARRFYGSIKELTFDYNRELAKSIDFSVIYYFEAAIADPDCNAKLKEIWRILIEKVIKNEINEQQFENYIKKIGAPLVITDPITGKSMLFTIDYAKSINDDIIKDPALRDEFINNVKSAALERYDEILKELRG